MVKKVVQVLPLERPQRTAVEAEQKLTQLPHQPRQAVEAAQIISRLSQPRLEAEAATNSAVCTINCFGIPPEGVTFRHTLMHQEIIELFCDPGGDNTIR